MLEFLFNKVADLRDTYFQEYLWMTASICNKILEKIRAVFHIYIKFDLNMRKTSWKKIQFQLALNKIFCPTPPLLIHQRLKHHQRTKINETMLSASLLIITIIKPLWIYIMKTLKFAKLLGSFLHANLCGSVLRFFSTSDFVFCYNYSH